MESQRQIKPDLVWLINKPPTPDLANMRGMTLGSIDGALTTLRGYFSFATANLIHDRVPEMADLRRKLIAEVARMLGFSEETTGLIKPAGSFSNADALFIARETTGRDKVVAFCSSHSSIVKAAHRLKMPLNLVPTQLNDFDPDLLIPKLDKETAVLVLTMGTTELGNLEYVPTSILNICLENGIHVHIDAAYGGLQFGLLPEDHPLKKKFSEMIHHPSVRTITIDAHKFVGPMDCSFLLFPKEKPELNHKSREYLEGMTYLQETTRGAQIPYQVYATMQKIGRRKMGERAMDVLRQAEMFEKILKQFSLEPIIPVQSGIVNIKLDSAEEADFVYKTISSIGFIIPKPVQIETAKEVINGLRFVLVPGIYYDLMFMEDFAKLISKTAGYFRERNNQK